MSTIDDAIGQVVRDALGPLATEVANLRSQLEAMRAELASYHDETRTASAPTPERIYLSPRQAAAKLGASTRSVHRWIQSGDLPARRLPSGGVRIAASDLDDLLSRYPAEAREE